jgi:hypothetical protein
MLLFNICLGTRKSRHQAITSVIIALFIIYKRVVKDLFESIHCKDSDPGFCLQTLLRNGILADRLGFPILKVWARQGFTF